MDGQYRKNYIAIGHPPYMLVCMAENSSESNMWSMLCHLSSLSGFVVPFGNLIGPIVIWAIKKNEMPSVDAHGKESINFQITVTIASIIAAILCFVLIGFVLLPIILIGWVILTVIAGIKANDGELYRYPLTIRFIK